VARIRKTVCLSLTSACTLTGALLGFASPAHADEVAYLVNVTVRPGYNFANADNALSYGHQICSKIATGIAYRQLIADIKTDFNTPDDYQASYLVTQAAQELCPADIWQLRNSAAGYTG